VKVLLSWLREFCPTDAEAAELADRLTRQGVKVESTSSPWEGLQGVVVARVLEVRDHPGSDKLCLARIDAGAEVGERAVVVGVRNMGPGDLVPYAGPGARVPVLSDPLGERRLRGELSQGMICSPWELGVSPLHQGILLLPDDSPVGADVKARFGLDDVLFDIEVKSNRPDLLSIAGVAREASAATGTPFVRPDGSVPESAGAKAADAATVEIRDLERCPRYLARIVRGVSVGASPIRVQARLTASGMRPLSNVVDATNYVMLETGQPMHPFDLALLEGASIVVRRAADSERLITLDEVERLLTSDDLVIADGARAVAIAGVMGSAMAEVSERTAEVLLESAHFERLGVRRTASRLNLQTEASTRFGRGADPEAVDPAAARAARLMVEWGGGEVLSGALDAGESPKRRVVAVRPERASLLLGDPVSMTDARDAFEALGLPVVDGSEDAIQVEVPGHRPDLEIEADLIEEVARVRHYDRIPPALPGVRQAGGVAPSYQRRARAREALVRAGLRETMAFSFASRPDLDLIGMSPGDAVAVANPLAADDAFLRPSLLPGLLRSVRSNVARGARGVALFEIGHVFRLHPDGEQDPGEGGPIDEREMVAAVLAGQASPGHPEPPRDLDVFDAKGALATALAALAPQWSLGGPPGPPFHPGRSARIVTGGRQAGVLGELHPVTAERLDLPSRVAVFELELTAVPETAGLASYREISRFPPVRRDLAFVVDAEVPAVAIADGILTASGGLATEAILFDLFEGPPLPPGTKNLAYAVEFRAFDRTLTAEEVEAVVRRIARALDESHGARLRTA
jgi:phenylalanyl-tRNA synthetase beta chain